MNSKIEFNESPDEKAFILQRKAMDLEAGWLGRCFGSVKNAPVNIAGLLIVLLAAPGVLVLFCDTKIPAGEYWKIIVPLLTLSMGYLFGKGSTPH